MGWDFRTNEKKTHFYFFLFELDFSILSVTPPVWVYKKKWHVYFIGGVPLLAYLPIICPSDGGAGQPSRRPSR